MRAAAFTVAAAVLLAASPALAQPFSYLPPGDLAPGSGEGREDYTVYAPGMRFPIEVAPAFVNSQVWGNGGSQGPGGSQCDEVNYSYPWRDNYCEERSWDMPLCPAGVGHQGEDIRPSTCDNHTHWAVAAVDGTITHIGNYSVYLTAADGTRYDYLHMSTVQVSVGQEVSRGDALGYVSNEYNGTPTTIHLHFNLRQYVQWDGGEGEVYVPSYMSLIRSYERLINQPPTGELVRTSCDLVEGWASDPDAPAEALDVLLAFDAEAGDPAATEIALLADLARSEPCEPAESCDHGFALPAPLSLFDGEPHALFAYGYDANIELGVELAESPQELECTLGDLDGYRREISDDAMTAWGLSAVIDLATVTAAELDALPASLDLGDAPELATDAAADELWLLDGPVKRAVDDEALLAWRLDAGAAESWTDAELAALPTGPPLRPRPVLLTAPGEPIYLLDDDLSVPGGEPAGEPGGVGGISGTNDGCACTLVTGHTPRAGWALLAAVALLPLVRRRRSRSSGAG